MKIAALLLAVSLVAACAVQPLPELPSSHPASPSAAEAPSRPVATGLSDDEASRTTAQLLAPASAPAAGMSHH
ncbi:MAG TPA: hypothetical protein VNB29_03725 [Chthoniobacterales bacterium]|nr:hypothetical protein [Chthoniobacterales bacterium]